MGLFCSLAFISVASDQFSQRSGLGKALLFSEPLGWERFVSEPDASEKWFGESSIFTAESSYPILGDLFMKFAAQFSFEIDEI
jgi:hypothetical protein